MRKLLLAGVLLIASAGLASAEPFRGQIKQKDSGTNWSNGAVDVPVGGPIILKMETIGTAATEYVVAHKSGNIVQIYVVQNGTTAGADTNLTFNVGDSAGDNFVPISGTVDHVTIANSGDEAGDVSTFTHDPTDLNQTVDVDKGDVISVATDGGDSGTTTDVVITIVIE